MSQIEVENKRQRGKKLCQLIYDRPIDNEIGFEIRKLFEEGVLIDFQDQNRNQKTAIHLAIEKRDVICVKFLLRFKPNLEVVDGDGKTPLELAESKGNQNILNALLNSTFDVVNESFVEVFDYKSLTSQKIEVNISRPTFKVLKLINCPSVNDVWKKFKDHNYARIIQETSHLFFIAIETNQTIIEHDPKLMKKVLNLRRPLIVQLISSNSQNVKIYFKDEKMKDFEEVADTLQINQEKFDVAVQSGIECNMKLLLTALRSNLFGPFADDLLGTKLNINEDRSEAVNQFARSNALCHRFFKLFNESPPQIDRIVATLSFNDDQSLLALLDLPFELKDEELKLNEYQQDILTVVYSSGCNLLMMAAEHRNLDAVTLLLRCGCDFNLLDNYDNRASDICWEMKAFDCLAELIEAGSPYPSNFRLDELDESSEASKRISAMIEAVNSFHENIEKGETEKVKKFITSHPLIKHAYDTSNKCALTVALQSNQVVNFSLLMSEAFEPGADDEYHETFKNFKNKELITKSHRKYFKEAFDEPHVKRLLKMSKLSFGSKDFAKCSKIIRRMFDELNEIDELIPILQICSLSEKLRIVFDFNCNSVADMDPTQGSTEVGVTLSDIGIVYIGAKNHETEFLKVIGTLIHELTHYAMKLAYDNDCKPYDVGDIENKRNFDTIAKETKRICDENPSTDAIVTRVFKSYKKEVWHAELIVRVPHLLAHYKTNPKALKASERVIPELFNFYRDEILKDIERIIKVWLQKYLIGKINKQTGIAQKIKNLKVQFEKIEVIDLKPSVNVITSNAPHLTLAILNQVCPPNFQIFVSLEQVATGNVLEKIAKVNAKESLTALIVDCIGLTQKYPESLGKLLKSLKNIKTIALVMTAAEGSKVREKFPKIEFKNLTHEWDELTESSKVHWLNQNVIFQGVKMKLNELVKPTFKAMNFFPLDELVNCKDFKIGSELHQASHKFYSSRKFIEKGQDSSTQVTENGKNFKELLRTESRMSAMIISDEAGSGKSVTLYEIAKYLHGEFPHRWVLFVDLKRHIEAFKSVEDHKRIKSLEDFIVQNILKSQVKSESEFDRELFIQMFRAGKTFVLFDGFDEISPNFKDLLLHVLKLFQPESGNQLFITTRPHLEADLKGALGEFVFKIEELSEEDQKDFLSKYLRSAKPEMSQGFEVISNRLFEKFSEISSSNIIGLPLLLLMTAEIFEDPIKENLMHKVESLSISSVFRKFVEEYFLRWTNNENEISRNENIEFVMAGGVLEVHHKIALNHIFDDKFMSLDVDESDAEEISRVGLIRYDKSEKTFQFIHETFAEYFVADFIWFHLNKKNRNLSHDCSKAVEVLIEVLAYNLFNVIETFLDQTLETMNFIPSELFCYSVAKYLSEIVKGRKRFHFRLDYLFTSRFASLFDLRGHFANLLWSIVKHVEKQVLLKMLRAKGFHEGSVLHYAAKKGSKATVSTLCGLITTCTDKPTEIYQDEGDFGNVLFRATENKNAGVLTTLCENLNAVLTESANKIMFQQRNHGENIIARAVVKSNDEVFLELISLLPNYLTPDEIKSLFRAVDGRNQNFFHQALTYNTSESLKVKFEVVKSNFSFEEQKTLFYQPSTGLKMFHCAAQNQNEKIFETSIESTRALLSGDEIKSMLMQKDSEGSNVIHKIAQHGNEVTLKELDLLLRERLYDDEIRSLLLEVNSKGQNCFRLAANNSKLGLQVFCETIGNLLPIEDQTRLLQQSIHEIDIIRLACGSYTDEVLPLEAIKKLLIEENVFHEVADRGDVFAWNKLISFAQARFSEDEMKSFLFCCNHEGRNCLHLAVSSWYDTNLTGAICKTIKAVLSVEDQKKFVRQKDDDTKNLFHLAVENVYTEPDLFALYDDLSTILSNDEIKEMLMEKDHEGDDFLCSNIKSPHFLAENVWLYSMPFLQKVLKYDEIKNHLLVVNREGKNFFSCAVQRSSKSQIKSLSKSIKGILKRDDQKILFGIKSPNVFHLAVENSESGIFSTLHECLKDVFDADEFKTLVSGSDSHGSNVLLLAAQSRDPFILEELLNFVQSELSIDDQRALIQKCDNDGENIFTFASRNDPEVYSVAENYAKEILSENQINKLKTKII